ncbi:MAG: hypothetical protein ACR2NM_04630, partial [Bythopirellula sp.]
MESAALFFVALCAHLSGLGVMFGWQPMPEGGDPNGVDKIEYIVQIEPELAKTLRAGQSIPITSDIPDDIGPIGRIRIVVGSDDLPKQKLATRFKPWPTKQSGAGLVETQFTVPPVQSSGADRYAAQQASNDQILPPGANGAAQNPFGRALQQGAEQARQLANDTKNQILPPANEIFGKGAAAGQGVQNALNNTTNQLRQGLQRNVEQVADRTGQRLRNAVDNVGQGAQDAIDKFGRKLTSEPRNNERSILNNGQNQNNNNTILPPGGQTNGQLGAAKRRIDQPIQSRQPQGQLPQAPPANFAASTPGASNPTSQPGVFNAPWPPVGGNPPPANTANNSPPPSHYGNQNSQPSSTNAPWPGNSTGRDNLDLANRPGQQAPPKQSSDRYANLNMASNGTEGPKFPGTGNQPNAQPPGNTRWPQQQPAPEIRRDMLKQPQSNSHMQTVGNINNQGYQHQTAARPPLDTKPGDLGWNQNNVNTAPENSDSNGNTTLFPLLLSWVLLSGSCAG